MKNASDSRSEAKIAFFGSSKVSIYVLEELVKAGLKPAVIVTTPDKRQGRGMVMTPNIVKTWAREHDIPTIEQEAITPDYDVFIVASYGKILPVDIVNMPRRKTLNVHPSLLPRYRGAAPLPTMMLDDTKNTGVTIMRMDEEMDHGPIVAKKEITVAEWPTYEVFEETMAHEGGKLLAEILPAWIKGDIKEQEQDHSKATFTKKIKKEDALLNMRADQSAADQYINFRKIQAYHEWPQAYFFVEKSDKQIRIKITQASYTDGKLTIEKVIPEGGKEMLFIDFLKGYNLR